MKDIINIAGLNTVDFIKDQKGTYRAIIKVSAGFFTVVDDLGISAAWGRQAWTTGIQVFRNFQKGALQSIEFKAEGSNHWLTVFALKGRRVILIDERILVEITVGDINSNWYNTNLYSSEQYVGVNATTWACKAFTLNTYTPPSIVTLGVNLPENITGELSEDEYITNWSHTVNPNDL